MTNLLTKSSEWSLSRSTLELVSASYQLTEFKQSVSDQVNSLEDIRNASIFKLSCFAVLCRKRKQKPNFLTGLPSQGTPSL